MTLDKDGCWAVDLFPVLQISGENPATSGLLHLIPDGQRSTRAALTWQVSLSLGPIIHWNPGRAENLKSLSEQMISSPSQEDQ